MEEEIVICFIPNDPYEAFIQEGARALEEMICDFYKGCDEVTIARSYEKPFFIDAGKNHNSIECPSCNTEIDPLIWQQFMSDMWCENSQGYNLKPVTAPCCNNEVSLNSMVYKPHQGFALFSAEVVNPKNTNHDEALQKINKISNIKFSMVCARY